MAVARKTLFKVHNGLGLAVLLFVLLSATTGAVLTFRGRLSEPPPEAPTVAEHLSVDELLARAVAEGDGSPATDITLALEPTDPYVVWLDDDAETVLYLDGAGNVLETRSEKGKLTRWLFRLHTGELLGVVGQGLMLATALGLCVLAWSGFSMWWSRRRTKKPRS